ncbi:hypothetical protein GCM10007877_00420 [Marinibactrum halimedae]|uniref:O-antigen ligase-related domain-containing protein n=2 Tax=Marinibactrum halimedae TaxID=1444977 RepID=A0AA37T310_9GAMM|nr:hypothetical protein GCM10007877_00420 [Marinibactrum halimedae]
MSVMLIALWIGHGNWSLGMAKTIKSSIGWAKGWALLAVFPLLGAIVPIRPEVITRGVCIIAVHTLIFSFITFIAYLGRIPGELYISPLQVVGGPGENFFKVSLYGLNPETGGGRWQFFGPWAPAAGFLSCIYLIFCLQEKNPKWRNWGVAGCVAMILLSQSRAGLGIFIMLFPLVLFSDKIKEPWMLITLGIVLPILLLLGEPVYEFVMNSYQEIKEQRPGSTRVRSALANIAMQRWEAEAPIWGHGVVERGPKLVEGMPIGSHHSWYGLLFVKGLVGLFSLAIPLFISAIYLLWQAQFSEIARSGLCMIAVFVCYSFFENLEILSYLYWPALLWLGMAFNPHTAQQKIITFEEVQSQKEKKRPINTKKRTRRKKQTGNGEIFTLIPH